MASGAVLATCAPDLADGGVLPAADAPAAHPIGIWMLADRLRRPVALDQDDGNRDGDDDEQREHPDDSGEHAGHRSGRLRHQADFDIRPIGRRSGRARTGLDG